MVSKVGWINLYEKYKREIQKKIDEIKNISNLKEQRTEINMAKRRFGMEMELGDLERSMPDSSFLGFLNNAKELFQKLDDLNTEIAKKPSQEGKKDSSNYKKNNASPKKQKSKEYTCDECGDTRKGRYKYHKSKNDGYKFCSSHCFFQHYAETCDSCYEKCLKYSNGKAVGSADTYYSDPQNKTGVLCSKCHQEKLKELSEEQRKDKKLEESCKKLDKNMNDIVRSMEDSVKGDGENEDKSEDNSNVDKNQESRIKNQESRIKNQESRIKNQESRIKNQESRIKNQLDYFSSNSIQSVELTDKGELVIKKTNQTTPTTVENLSLELREIKSEMEKNNIKKLTREELEQSLKDLEEQRKKLEKGEEKEPKKSNLGLKIGIGALVGVVLVGLVVVIVRNKRIKSKK